MSAKVVSRRYAQALIDIGGEEKAIDKFGESLRDLVATFAGNGELYKTLLNPMYDLSERKSLADAIAKKIGAADSMKKFIELLVETRKIRLLDDIAEAYFHLEDELAGRLRATVTSPTDIDKKLKDVIKKRLEDETKKEVILSFETSPELIGGLVLRVGNTILDGSIKTQLEKIKEKTLEGVV